MPRIGHVKGKRVDLETIEIVDWLQLPPQEYELMTSERFPWRRRVKTDEVLWWIRNSVYVMLHWFVCVCVYEHITDKEDILVSQNLKELFEVSDLLVRLISSKGKGLWKAFYQYECSQRQRHKCGCVLDREGESERSSKAFVLAT